MIDDFAVYASALTGAEINALADGLKTQSTLELQLL